jgi:hypothetical protein
MPGKASVTSLDGVRSEALAQFLLCTWGTAVTVGQQDYGLDLHCALTEHVGGRAWAKEPYAVQVKSDSGPWRFSTPAEVRWLVEHPLPLYLCVVEKAKGRILLYHTFPRFLVRVSGQLPDSLILVPGEGPTGTYVEWGAGPEFSLSAPILEVDAASMFDQERLAEYRRVLEQWIAEELWNLNLCRAGLYRFRMPASYTTNSKNFPGWAEQGLGEPNDALLKDGVLHLCEALDCIGSQLARKKDTLGALEATMLVRFLQQRFAVFFKGNQAIDGPRNLCFFVNHLNTISGGGYVWKGLDTLVKHLKSHPLVRDLAVHDLGSE